MASHPKIAIVGGGPGGLLLARLLLMRGCHPTVFERDARAAERPQGGSLDLHAETGQRAMRLAGLETEFSAASRPEDQGDRLYDQHGALLFDHDGAGDDRPEIDRTALRQILLASLEPDVVRWGSRVDAVISDAGGGHSILSNGHAERFDIVVGADGAWSQVRSLLNDVKPSYEGVTLIEFGCDDRNHPHVASLVGSGKMFAAGRNRLLIGQRNSHGHIRCYAGLRIPELSVPDWAGTDAGTVRSRLRDAFDGWATSLTTIFEHGELLGVRPLYALPIDFRWVSRPGVTLLGDAAHLMSPFSGEGVNLALADAVDLAEALIGESAAVAQYEIGMVERAAISAEGAAEGLRSCFADDAVAAMLDHYRERTEG